jgi:hypothetical protein
MTLLEFEELAAYWTEHPPVHILVAAYLDAGRTKQARMQSDTRRQASSKHGDGAPSDVGAILAELGPGFGSGDVHAGLAPVVLDFKELQRRATYLVDRGSLGATEGTPRT